MVSRCLRVIAAQVLLARHLLPQGLHISDGLLVQGDAMLEGLAELLELLGEALRVPVVHGVIALGDLHHSLAALFHVGADRFVVAFEAALLIGPVALVEHERQADQVVREQQRFVKVLHGAHDGEGVEKVGQLLHLLLGRLADHAVRHVVRLVLFHMVLRRHGGHALNHHRRLQVRHPLHPLDEVPPKGGGALPLPECDSPAVEGEVVVERLAHARHEHERAVDAALFVHLFELP